MSSRIETVLDETRPFPGHIKNSGWSQWINAAMPESEVATIRRNTSTGRPTGSDAFIESIEDSLDRILKRQKPGRKPKSELDDLTGDLFAEI